MEDLNASNNGVLRIKVENRWLRSWNFKYLKSTRGILRMITMAFALVAFIAEESTPYCHYGYSCVITAYTPTYKFFAVVTMGTVIISVITLFINLNRYISHDLINPLRLMYAEIAILASIAFLLLFADIFIIGQSGGRISYQAAAVLGTISLIAAEAHLILIAMQLRKMLRKLKKSRGQMVSEVDGCQDATPRTRDRLQITEPVLLSAVDKNNAVYANCEVPINNRDEIPEYLSSDSFDDSSDDDKRYPKQVRLEITKN